MFLVPTFLRTCVCSFHAFGSLTEADIFEAVHCRACSEPNHYITAKFSNPRLVQLRRTATVASGVAKALINGKGNRDVLTLLGEPMFLKVVCTDIFRLS